MPPFIPHPAPLPLGEGIENLALHHAQKVPMHGQVAASFGVKRRHQNVTLEQARGDVAPGVQPALQLRRVLVGVFCTTPRNGALANGDVLYCPGCAGEVAIDTRFGEAVVVHQRFDERSLLPALAEFLDLRRV